MHRHRPDKPSMRQYQGLMQSWRMVPVHHLHHQQQCWLEHHSQPLRVSGRWVQDFSWRQLTWRR